MKYVVTGGAGFIGSHLAQALLARGHQVVVIDNLFSGRRENLDDVAASVGGDAGERLVFLEADILDREIVAAAIDGASAVFHQAAIASVPRSFADPAATLRANVEGTATLLEACRDAGVRRFVMASSSSIYGDTPSLPKCEEMQPAPKSPYALSKRVDEDLLRIWAEEYGLETVGLRYFNVFGPRQDPASEYAAVVPKFITRMLRGQAPVIYGDGLQSRDFTYVDNAVRANLLAAEVDPQAGSPLDDGGGSFAAAGRAMNVGVGERTTLLELVEELNRIMGTDLAPRLAEPRAGDVRHSHAAIDRARQLIGYRPAVGFRDGLESTVAWFVDRRARRSSSRSRAG